jgi:hypothetical protein
MAAGNSGGDKKKALKAAQRGAGVKQAADSSEPEPLSEAALAIDKASRNVGESLTMQRARHMIEGAFSDEDKVAGLAKVVRNMMYNDSSK